MCPDVEYLNHRQRHKILRRRTQTRVSLVVFWILFVVAVVLIASDKPGGSWVAGLGLGWAAAGATRAMIDAHYVIKGS